MPDQEPRRVDGGEDVVDRICSTLSAAISSGALKPGAKVMDAVIAEHFGVSRTVVRGALDILQRDHLLARRAATRASRPPTAASVPRAAQTR